MHYALSLSHVLASHWQGFYMEYIVHSQMPQIKKIGARFARRFVVVLKLKNWGPSLGIPSFFRQATFLSCLPVCLSVCLSGSVCLSACLFVSACHCLPLIVSVSEFAVC